MPDRPLKDALHGPDRYWSPTDPPSRGQIATLAALGLTLLDMELPETRQGASTAIVRLQAALAEKEQGPR